MATSQPSTTNCPRASLNIVLEYKEDDVLAWLLALTRSNRSPKRNSVCPSPYDTLSERITFNVYHLMFNVLSSVRD